MLVFLALSASRAATTKKKKKCNTDKSFSQYMQPMQKVFLLLPTTGQGTKNSQNFKRFGCKVSGSLQSLSLSLSLGGMKKVISLSFA